MRMKKFVDAANIGQVKRTSDGYVTAYARAVRTGIQRYTADEMGIMGGGYVNVYRPPEEVFAADSLASFSHAPVTLGHPSEGVTAENWKDYAVGEVSTEALRDGDFIALPLILKDAAAIAALDGGTRELSAGYTADIDFVDGVAPDGQEYQAVMRGIKINHLALVPKARAGSQARIGDADKWGASPANLEDNGMTELVKVVFGDKHVSVEAKDADTVAAIIADHKTEIDAKDAEIGELTVKLAAAEAKVLSDEQVAEMVAGKVKADTQRAAVKAAIGDKADAMSDAQIEGAFMALGDAVKVDDAARNAIADKPQVNDHAASRQAMIDRLQNGYKGSK